MPIGGLAIIGLVGALITSAPWPGFLTQMLGGNPSLWDRNAASFGVVTADNFSLFVVSVLAVDRHHHRDLLEPDHRARRAAGGRVLRDHAVLDRRHDADGAGQRPAVDLPRARDDVDRRLRADRHPPRQRRRHGSGLQVLPARRLCQRVLPLRHRVPLRGDPEHAPRHHQLGDCGPVDERQPVDPARRRPADRRLRLQDRRGAVPHVVARRLRGRAGGRHRFHVHRRQGRGRGRVRARVSQRARSDGGRLGAGARA